MNKKFFIVIGGVMGLVILGLAIFWFLYPGAKPSKESVFPGLFPEEGERLPGKQPAVITAPPPTIQPGEQQPLNQLTQKPISAATFLEKQKEDKTKISLVRYIEKATGHIYDIELPKGTPLRISNVTMPGIFEAYWSPDAGKAVIRYTEKNNNGGMSETVRNFSLIDVTATSTKGIFLLSTISAIVSSPEENKIFYLMPWENTNIGMIASFEDKQQKQIFSTPFGEFLVSWPSKNTITLLTRPSAFVRGFLYKLDATSGSLERLLKDIKGLTALLSPSGERVLYSESSFEGLQTSLYNAKEKKTAIFPVTTLPEKCVWSKISKEIIYCAVPQEILPANYPDDWYQGLVSFSDRIWKINIIDGTTEIISKGESDFDFINLFLPKSEDYLFLQNKKDGTLWSLQLVD